jgi:hypothetical protein
MSSSKLQTMMGNTALVWRAQHETKYDQRSIRLTYADQDA